LTGVRSPGADLFINRELSWLAFNERVLEEAADRTNPLLERIKFAAIVASNLDEFFMVRVAGLHRNVTDGDESPDLAGLTPAQQLAAVRERVHALVKVLYQLVLGELMPSLVRAGVRIVSWTEIDRAHQTSLGTFFREAVLPVLTPPHRRSPAAFAPLLAQPRIRPAARGCIRRDRGTARHRPGAGVSRAWCKPASRGRSCCWKDIIAAHLPPLLPRSAMRGVGIDPARRATPSWSWMMKGPTQPGAG
jgi:hypothetical protein